METVGGPSKEEFFEAFLRKIQGQGYSEIEKIKVSLERSTVGLLVDSKKWKNEVSDSLARSIRDIDELIGKYKCNGPESDPEALELEKKKSLEEIITGCTQQIEDYMDRFKKGEVPEEKNNGSHERQAFIAPEYWLKTAVDTVDDKLQVTAPGMRYNDLEPPLKRCLIFLSVFPENAIIHKRSLIYWWIGEGLMRPNKSQTAEQAGEQCFKMLLLNGLILPLSKKHDKKARCCKLHSSVRGMLIYEAEKMGVCFKIYSNEMLTKKSNEDDECPISCLAATTNEQSVMVSSVSLDDSSNEFLSLFNISAQYLICDSDKFSKFKSIKVLQLGRWQILSDHHIEVTDTKFLESLGVMKNLRYLSLQGISRITWLPDSLVHLTNLRVLDLRACHNLEKLPTGIGSLKHLTHLDVSECSLLDRMPMGLSSLSELEVLKGFIISTSRDSGRLKDLADLRKLRKLSINIARGAKANEDLILLKKFTTLSSLTIIWGQQEVPKMLSETASEKPSEIASEMPTEKPSEIASEKPSEMPPFEISLPDNKPSEIASEMPTEKPSEIASEKPSEMPPFEISLPDNKPSEIASEMPTEKPSEIASEKPSEMPPFEISLPDNLEKLDLQCIPQAENLNGLKRGESNNLKKLYIRGGKLKGLITADTKAWQVEILRLKFLKELELDEWSTLLDKFQSLDCIEIYKCPKVKPPQEEGSSTQPISEDTVWKKNNEGKWIPI